MRILFMLLMIVTLGGCSAAPHDSTDTVKQFYHHYMARYTADDTTALDDYSDPLYQHYVANDVITRLKYIASLDEQEIVSSDYFLYVQDFSPAWAATFRAGKARAFLGGEQVDVWIGGPGDPEQHLKVFTRRENGTWKIYRVRDEGHHYEQAIYSAGAVAQAAAWAEQLKKA